MCSVDAQSQFISGVSTTRVNTVVFAVLRRCRSYVREYASWFSAFFAHMNERQGEASCLRSCAGLQHRENYAGLDNLAQESWHGVERQLYGPCGLLLEASFETIETSLILCEALPLCVLG